MNHRLLAVLAVSLSALILLFLTPVGTAISQELQDVLVVNFPDPQRVRGTVTIENPVPSARLFMFENVTVPPVRPTDTTRLIKAGTLVTDGFQFAVLSIVGSTRGETLQSGSVGALLIPDQAPIRRAFFEDGDVLLSLEIEAVPAAGPPAFFASNASRQPLAFPGYQVLLYNTTDKTVTVTLYAYLTNG